MTARRNVSPVGCLHGDQILTSHAGDIPDSFLALLPQNLPSSLLPRRRRRNKSPEMAVDPKYSATGREVGDDEGEIVSVTRGRKPPKTSHVRGSVFARMGFGAAG